MNLVSIDFETANHSRISICAAGIAVFENGILVESLHWLVRPPKGHGRFRKDFIECHGLTPLDVLTAHEFPPIAGLARTWAICALMSEPSQCPSKLVT